MTKLFLTTAICLLFFVSCNKKKVEPTTTENSDVNYKSQPTIGSYWIYQCNEVDADGNITPTSTVDTVRVIGDTLIGGNIFKVYKGNQFGHPSIWYERDSSCFIVDEIGEIIYGYSNFNSIISSEKDVNYSYEGRLIDLTSTSIQVPAGVFHTIDHQLEIKHIDGTNLGGCNTLSFTMHTHFASGVGMIKSMFIYNSSLEKDCHYTERVLSSYHIQ